MTMEAYDATLRLGTRLSVCAAAVAMLLSMLGDVSEPSFVFSVLLIGSLASWIQSSYTMRADHGTVPAFGRQSPPPPRRHG